MRKVSCVQDLVCMFPALFSSSSCLCSSGTMNNHHDHDCEDEQQSKPLIMMNQKQKQQLQLKDLLAPPPTTTLAFQLKPKMVVLRVSMHCNGCARKVEKHISKLDGVTSYEIDLETKMVVIKGDIVPFQVLESVSKVKYAQLWDQSTF